MGLKGYLRTTGIGLFFVLSASAVAAQTVYRWEDERGVVHFSDAPPRNAKNVESRNLPSVPQPAIRLPQGSTSAQDAAESKGGESEDSEREAAPARVEVKRHDVDPVAEATSEFSGEVENVGDTPAKDVIVVVEVTETNQGADCLREEVDVSPSSLGPGEKGTYSITLSNPCFYGPIATTVRPEWN